MPILQSLRVHFLNVLQHVQDRYVLHLTATLGNSSEPFVFHLLINSPHLNCTNPTTPVLSSPALSGNVGGKGVSVGGGGDRCLTYLKQTVNTFPYLTGMS